MSLLSPIYIQADRFFRARGVPTMNGKKVFGSFALAGVLTVGGAAFFTPSIFSSPPSEWFNGRSPADQYVLASIYRTDLFPKLRATGRVESSVRTVIKCELERIATGGAGQSTAGGASTLLTLVPEGREVRKGDVLAQLDASVYEELLRQQRIAVEQARATHLQAQLNLEIAKLAVQEYKEGIQRETIKQMEGQLALARSDVERASDRVDWTQRMNDKGYASVSQVTSDKHTLTSVLLTLERQQSAFNLFQRFTAPKDELLLQGDVKAAESTMRFEQQRLQQSLDRLALLERQVERCTIRAPHDGFIIHANNSERDIRIEEGMSVRQKQELFFLPDLSQMEVVAMLHETVVDKVQVGMSATITTEAMPQYRMEGNVASIATLPTFDRRTDLRYFPSVVKLDQVPHGIKPGMTAQIEIVLARRDDVVVIPTEAIHTKDGRSICYVAREEGLEPRSLELGLGTHEFIEVVEGVREGERVVLARREDM
jgi:HlyD family secretion protein